MSRFRSDWYYRHEDDYTWKLIVGVLAVIALIVTLQAIVYASTAEVFTGTVVKTAVQEGETFFVIQDDGGRSEIYENEDVWYMGKINSGDVLMDLQVGRRYTFTVAGWRVQLLSWYRNIISYKVSYTPAPAPGQ